MTEQQIVDACAQQLSAYKVPKLVEMRDSLPRSAVGKALRRELLAQEKAKGVTGG